MASEAPVGEQRSPSGEERERGAGQAGNREVVLDGLIPFAASARA